MPSRVIKKYIEDCKKLKRDLKHAISDLEFQQDDGIIRYAVDFAEIYAYVLPEETAKEFFLFVDESLEKADLLQRRALKQIFLDSKDKLILLAPYVIELNSFLTYIRKDSFYKQLGKVPLVINHLNNLLLGEKIDKFKSLVERKVSGEKLLDREEKEIVEFLEKNADVLLVVFFDESKNSQPIELIQQLFQSERFESTENLVGSDFSLDKEVRDNQIAQRLYQKFIFQSGKNTNISSRLDAIAIAAIEKTNRELKLQNKNIRLFLITRSERMHEVFEQELQDNLWSESFLRHPRVFDLLAKIEVIDQDVKIQIQELKSRLDFIELFLKLVSDLDKLNPIDWHHLGDERNHQSVQNDIIAKIKQDWKSRENITEILENTPISSFSQVWKKDIHKMEIILKFLQNPQNFRELLFDRLKQLTIDWQRSHQLLGFDVQTSDPDKQNSLKQKLKTEKFSRKYVLKTTKTNTFPFSLQFYSDTAIQLLKHITTNKQEDNFNWLEVIKDFEQNLDKGSDYELLLAMACILATLDKWEFAEEYCKSAINVDVSENSVVKHEGYFFLAICLRKWSPENSKECKFKRSLESIENLNRAIELKKQISELKDVEDPRYLKEKGLQILRLDVYFKDELNKQINEKENNNKIEEYLSADAGIKLLENALNLTPNDIQLKIQIYNNLIFYLIEKLTEKDNPEHRKTINNYYEKLTELLKDDKLEESDWLPSVLDTIAMTKWKLGNKTEKDKQESIRLLNLALATNKPSPEERKAIEQHHREIDEWKNSIQE